MHGGEQSSERTGSSQKHPVYRSGTELPDGSNNILLLHPPNTKTKTTVENQKRHTRSETFHTINPLAGLLVEAPLHMHFYTQVYVDNCRCGIFFRDRVGKLVTLFLIGTEILSFFPLGNPSRGMLINCPYSPHNTPTTTSNHLAARIHFLLEDFNSLQNPVVRSRFHSSVKDNFSTVPLVFSFPSTSLYVTGSAWQCTHIAGLRRPEEKTYLVLASSQLVPCPCVAVAP